MNEASPAIYAKVVCMAKLNEDWRIWKQCPRANRNRFIIVASGRSKMIYPVSRYVLIAEKKNNTKREIGAYGACAGCRGFLLAPLFYWTAFNFRGICRNLEKPLTACMRNSLSGVPLGILNNASENVRHRIEKHGDTRWFSSQFLMLLRWRQLLRNKNGI